VLEELQVPPPASLRVTDEPEQTAVGPEMFAGKGFTVNTVEVLHPVGIEYVITTVPDSVPVVIHPPVPIVATFVLLVLHVPPTVISVKQVDEPKQTK
jgi:hypothetical protein